MNELRSLLFLELRSLYGINSFLHTKDPKAKNRYRMLTVAWIILIITVFSYVGGLVYGLCTLGLEQVVPAYLVVLASLLIIAFGIFTAGSRIFGQKGYDLLASMPIKPGLLVISRFLSLYAEDLILTLVVLVPGTAVYGLCQKPDLGFYLAALLGALLIPGIPLVISVLLGSLVTAISSRMKQKSLAQTVLMVALVIGVLLGSFQIGSAAENLTPEAFSQLAQTIGSLLGQVYPPALWLANAMAGDPLGLGLFFLVSLAAVVLTVWVVSRNFHSILGRLQSFPAGHNYKLGALESRSLLKALYLREARRYFSSSIYVTNTIIGPVLGTVMALSLWALGLDSLTASLPANVDVPGLLPFVFAGVFCIMTTTCTSISLEGKQFWVVKSLPIPTKALLDSKILLNLSILLPCYLLSLAALAIATRPDFLQLLGLMFIPASIMLFSVVFGITVNLKFHSFHWEKEETVVKQSLPAALGGFAGFFLSAALGFAVFLVPAQYAALLKGLMCGVLLGLTALLYSRNNKFDLSQL